MWYVHGRVCECCHDSQWRHVVFVREGAASTVATIASSAEPIAPVTHGQLAAAAAAIATAII